MHKITSGLLGVLIALGLGGCGDSSNGGGGTGTGTGSTGTGGGGTDDCVRVCEKGKALHCAMDTDTTDCATGCQAEVLLPICQVQWAALMSCSANAPVTCGTTGKPTTQGCSSEGLAYFSCLLGGLDAGFGTD